MEAGNSVSTFCEGVAVKGRTLDGAVVNIDVFTPAAIFVINEHDVTHLYFVFGMGSFKFGVIVCVPELFFIPFGVNDTFCGHRGPRIYSPHTEILVRSALTL